MNDSEGLRDKLARQSEDALGKIAQDLLENQFVNGAISRAFEARERAVQAQEAAMGALNIPSAADIERLTRRLRSVSQRLEGSRTVSTGSTSGSRPSKPAQRRRGAAVGDRVPARQALRGAGLARLRAGLAARANVPREQERLEVDASLHGRPATQPQGE